MKTIKKAFLFFLNPMIDGRMLTAKRRMNTVYKHSSIIKDRLFLNMFAPYLEKGGDKLIVDRPGFLPSSSCNPRVYNAARVTTFWNACEK